jgi:hypothetical protein
MRKELKLFWVRSESAVANVKRALVRAQRVMRLFETTECGLSTSTAHNKLLRIIGDPPLNGGRLRPGRLLTFPSQSLGILLPKLTFKRAPFEVT